jgi:hypothetical protein
MQHWQHKICKTEAVSSDQNKVFTHYAMKVYGGVDV